MPTDSFSPIRRLGPGDLKRCVALSVDRGWPPERSKWALLLAASEAFGLDAPDGQGLAGAVVLTRWGPDLASIGMMLVAARYGRRGLGRALMKHVIAEAGQATVTLFATDMGRPLYEQLGFQPVRRNVSFAGAFRPDPASASAPAGATGCARAATEADLPGILAVDRAAFGADRSHVLRRLPGFADRITVLADRITVLADPSGPATSDPALSGPATSGPATSSPADQSRHSIRGYAAAWRNTPSSTVIGPLVAPDPQAAGRLTADLAARAHGSIRLDLDPDRPEFPAWAHAHGLEPVGRTIVMAYGELTPRGAPDRLFTPISVALA